MKWVHKIAYMREALSVILIACIAIVMAAIPAYPNTPESDWVPLFNGKDLTGWVVPEKGNWNVENGEIVVSWSEEKPGGGWIMTEETFEDFILKMKFRINKGGNSGVAIRYPGEKNPAYSGYEIQIQSSNLKNPTGSIYNLARAYSEIGFGPTAEKISKDEEWNEFEISAVGDHIVVMVNGRKVVERFDRRSLKGSIGMQLHDAKSMVRFKDIKVKILPAQRPLGTTMEERLSIAPGEFKKLFNGKNLDGWRILWGGDWNVVDGVIEADIDDGMGWLCTEEEYSDFIFKVNVKIAKGGNSGLIIRFPFPATPEEQRYEAVKNNKKLNPAHGGYEIQVLDYRLPQIGNDAGSIYDISRSPVSVLKPGEWNLYEVYAEGNHLAVYINGDKVAEAVDDRSSAGVVGMQAHFIAGEHEMFDIEIDPYKVWFKDIEIKAVK